LNDSCVTIAEALKPAGYKTLMSGKWHVGPTRPHWPCDRGFDQSFTLINGAMNYFGHNFQEQSGAAKNHTLLAMNDQPFDAPMEGFYSTDAFADQAITFMKQSVAERKPFFLYLAFNAPHYPLQAKPEDIARYEGKYAMGWEKLREQRHQRQIELGIVEEKWGMTPPDPDAPSWNSLSSDDKEQWAHRMAVYAAQVECLDRNIGRVIDSLKEAGIEKNTLVMFMSDNGASAETVDRSAKNVPIGSKESWNSYHLGWGHASNTPFRLYKHWDHEGGIASPFIAYWPGTIQPGAVSNQIGHVIDMMPTVLAAAGTQYPKEFKGHPITPVEGKSLLPIFKGTDAAVHDMLFWEHEGNKAVRAGDLKLVSKFPGDWELFDMVADRTEMHDIAKDRPDDVKRLAAAWQAWAQKMGVKPWDPSVKAKAGAE
jgi:arylsulfatase